MNKCLQTSWLSLEMKSCSQVLSADMWYVQHLHWNQVRFVHNHFWQRFSVWQRFKLEGMYSARDRRTLCLTSSLVSGTKIQAQLEDSKTQVHQLSWESSKPHGEGAWCVSWKVHDSIVSASHCSCVALSKVTDCLTSPAAKLLED